MREKIRYEEGWEIGFGEIMRGTGEYKILRVKILDTKSIRHKI